MVNRFKPLYWLHILGFFYSLWLIGCQRRPAIGEALAKRESQATKGMQGPSKRLATATFAGGCFWCMEPPFEKLDGVIEVISGYAGGKETSPTYRQVAAGKTGHAEAVQVRYDPKTISYRRLLDVFWRHVDPTDKGGQFVDRAGDLVD